jgi:DNA polymerase-3 subunit epsilon
MTTGHTGVFVPPHDVDWVLAYGDPQALALNGYRERLATAAQDTNGHFAHALARALFGNTLTGANPAFDAAFLGPVLHAAGCGWFVDLWHHRLGDLCAYTAGALRIPITRLPGLASVCELLGVHNTAPHTALGDVQATVACLHKLGVCSTLCAPAQDEVSTDLQSRDRSPGWVAITPDSPARDVLFALVHLLNAAGWRRLEVLQRPGDKAAGYCIDAHNVRWHVHELFEPTGDLLGQAPTPPPPGVPGFEQREVLHTLVELLKASGWHRLEAVRTGSHVGGYCIDDDGQRWKLSGPLQGQLMITSPPDTTSRSHVPG